MVTACPPSLTPLPHHPDPEDAAAGRCLVGLPSSQNGLSLSQEAPQTGFASQSSFAYNTPGTGQQRRREDFGYALRGRDL